MIQSVSLFYIHCYESEIVMTLKIIPISFLGLVPVDYYIPRFHTFRVMIATAG